MIIPPISPTAERRDGPVGGDINPWTDVSSMPSANDLIVTL